MEHPWRELSLNLLRSRRQLVREARRLQDGLRYSRVLIHRRALLFSVFLTRCALGLILGSFLISKAASMATRSSELFIGVEQWDVRVLGELA